jgi:hypothetical protein
MYGGFGGRTIFISLNIFMSRFFYFKYIKILKQEASDFGKFTCVKYIDKNKIELWEPPKSKND